MNLRILEIRDGLIQIKLPLPFELREVNVYLTRLDDGGWMLIDTGYYEEDCFETLAASLRELRIEWPEIRTMLLTHMHPDHIGNAHRILALTGARVLMHAVESEHQRAIAEAGKPPWFGEMMRLAGTPPELEAQVHHAFTHIREHSRVIVADDLLQGGERIPTAIGELEVIHTPGHSPGHICLYEPREGLFLAGDHMLPGITPNIGWLPQQDTLGDYLSSLEKVAPYEVSQVLPAHGKPFTGHRQWLKATADHHEERCREIESLIAGGVRGAHDMVCRLWPRRLDPFHYQFAVSEVMAHLVYMKSQPRRYETSALWLT